MSGPPINVIIPLGGLGSRFQKEGYLTRPKPFVRVLGKEMILWVVDNLSIRSDDGLVLVYNPSWMSMDVFMREILAAKYPQATLVELPGPTRGAAETVMLGLRGLDERVRGRATLLADGDTFYTADIVNRFREASTRPAAPYDFPLTPRLSQVAPKHNAVFCFHDTQPKPIYSYCRLKDDGSNLILETKEKIKISDWANSGCYCFRDGIELERECDALLRAGETQLSQDKVGEYYTSGVIAKMLADGAPFVALKLNAGTDINVLGTPAQVETFAREWPGAESKRFVFDLDHTLVTGPRTPGDFSTCEPIARNVEMCRAVHGAGHTVIIATERRGGDDVGQATIENLRRLNVPYDELVFGKPSGDVIVDDLACDPLLGDLQKQTGFYLPLKQASSTASNRSKMSDLAGAQSERARSSFNLGLVIGSVFGATLTLSVLKAARLGRGKM